MFIRVIKRPNTEKRSVQIVKSIRTGKKVRQKIIQVVGYAFDDDTIERLKDVAEHIKAKLLYAEQPTIFPVEKMAEMAIQARKNKEKDKELPVNLKTLREQERVIVGIHEAYGRVYHLLDFETVLTKRNLAARKILYHITMARLANPVSKRASVAMLNQDFGIQLNVNNVYRMMDKIDDKAIDKIQKKAQETTNTLLKNKVNVIFYDCTTLYFESFSPDELKQNGYSKDGKFNQPQVLLALLVTEEGLPIGYEVFPGGTFEGNTLAPVLDKLKKQHQLDRVVFIADSALLSKKNRAFLEKNEYQYILGERLKSLPDRLKKQVIQHENYTKTTKEDETHTVAEFEFGNNRLITSYSKKRAKKEQHDRETAVEKLKKRLEKSSNPKSLLSNYGYKKYVSLSDDTHLFIDQQKMEEDSRWDGLGGVITNVKDVAATEIIKQYRGLWQIESCFRIQKHNLKVRPIFHWTPHRVRAHIAMCYMAFTCQRYLSYRLKLQNHSLSVEEIRNALMHIEFSILKSTTTGACYGIPSKITTNARKIYKTLRLDYDSNPFLIT